MRKSIPVPFVAETVIKASEPLVTLLVVIPMISPAAYPFPPTLLVIEIDETCPELLVATVAVAPDPLPVMANKGTLL